MKSNTFTLDYVRENLSLSFRLSYIEAEYRNMLADFITYYKETKHDGVCVKAVHTKKFSITSVCFSCVVRQSI
jgi:hypothetical protein